MKFIFLIPIFLLANWRLAAQDSTSTDSTKIISQIKENLSQQNSKTDTTRKFIKTISKVFGMIPYDTLEKPRIALFRSLLFPGWGQITNRDYWKLPLIYGAAGAGWYFGNVVNNRRYKQYLGFYEKTFNLSQSNVFLPNNTVLSPSSTIYLEIVQKNKKVTPIEVYFSNAEGVYYDVTKSSTDTYTANQIATEGKILRGPYAENTIQSAKNQFRRWRDLSRIGFAAGWLFFAIEANASAHLKAFNVTDDISMTIKPEVPWSFGSPAFGVNLTFNFK